MRLYDELVAIQEPLRTAVSSADVTLLFSDIEGSTARWKMYPDAMPDHLRKHDELMRAAIERHGGAVFKTVGDEFCAVFTHAEDALAAAADAQRDFSAVDWSAVGGLRVRMAVHRGPASVREGDYFGTTVNRVARLLSAGHGGQILVSAQAAGTIGDEPRDGSSLMDLGRHRLRDFPELESVFQLTAPDLPDVFPPLRTIAERPTNLPQNLPSLIGREADIEDVAERLRLNRLISLIGAGGVGKTALALQIGTRCLSQFEDGAWLVELAPVDADAVVPALAAAFGITMSGGALLDAVTEHLKAKNLLLIVDNCEHVNGAATQALDTVLRRCGGVHVLATSREPLNAQGEVVYRLPVLAVPRQGVLKAEDVRAYAACKLFEERARAHVAGFEITNENAAVVAGICRRLDGIALAIELAAPRLRMMTLAQLSERLTERFRLLTGGSRNTLPHHQTMRALIDWSYQLLCENERALLRRSALFPGGWTIGAAVEICTGESLEEWDILDHLTSLVDKSLIVADLTGNEQRYHLLESTREYALERLQESGERDIVSLKQAQYFLRLAEQADAAWPDVPAKAWIAPLEDELDNFRAALSWCATQHHAPLLGLRLFGALEAFWWDAQPVEGRRWLEHFQSLANDGAPTAQTARYWLTAAGIALSTAQEKMALIAGDNALAAYEHIQDHAGIAAAQRCRGAALIRLGKIDDGEAAIRSALDLFRAHNHHRLTALALRTLAAARLLHGDMEAAAQVYREALPLSQALEDERGVQIISGNLAEIEALSQNYEQALTHGREALEIARSRRDWVMVCTLLINVTAYLLALDRFSEARLAAREALSIAVELRSEIHLAVAIQHLAAVAAHCGDPERSARLIGYADAAYARLENSREPNEAREYERTLYQLGERLPARTLKAQRSAGAVLTADQAEREALLT